MDYLLSIRMEEKVGMSLLTAIPISGDEISLGIFSSSEKGRKVLEDLERYGKAQKKHYIKFQKTNSQVIPGYFCFQLFFDIL